MPESVIQVRRGNKDALPILDTAEFGYCLDTDELFIGNEGTNKIVAGGGIGYTGSQGDLGLTGYTGSQGDQGNIGYTGSQGDLGYSGSQGIQGETGYTGSEGIQGDIGYTGSQGDQGIQGEIGYTGSQGDQGIQGEIGYTGSQGIQGDQGDIGYTGSQGIQGEIGYTGSQGIQGIIGYTGSQGIQGIQGETGDIGYTGSQGDQGLEGYTGSQGIQGSIGYTGSQGDQGLEGYTGSQGIQGDIGYTGSQGIQGDLGYTGSQGSQGDIGYTGSQGDQGIQGDIGYTGSQGIQGEIGYTGSQGIQGDIGYTGSQGEQGNIGYTGSQGEQGIIGYTGSQGIQGEIGYTGSQGIQGDIGYTGSQGDQGIQGEIGYTGSQGIQGDQGDIGYTGSQGELGYTGSEGVGYTGSEGAQGASGYTGSTGDIGYTGSAGSLGYTPVDKAGDTMIGFLTLNADPTSDLHAVTKQYADAIAAGIRPKGAVRAATIEDITLYDVQTIDTVTLIEGDRVLVKDQTDATENGIYIVKASDDWIRADDCDGTPEGEVVSGISTFCFDGDVNLNTGWVLISTNPISVGVSDLIFTLFNISGEIIAGAGLVKSINTLDIGSGDGITVNADSIEVKLDGLTLTKGENGLKVTDSTFAAQSHGHVADDISLTTDDFIKNLDENVTDVQKLAEAVDALGVVGYTGSQGDIGYTGSQGVQGDLGYTGSQGDIGYTGSQGTEGDLGYTGSQGDQGDIGYTGSQGVQGDIGYTGSQGSQGDIGYTGSQGVQGDLGYTGSQGSQGDIGYTGSQGSQGDIGYTGSQGVQGDIGYAGSQGNLGYTGSQGDQGDIGYTGSQGIQGNIGYTGSRGDVGYTGSQGTQGVIGYTGSQGIQGGIGYTGSQGTQGVIGYTGSQGIQGGIGYTGSRGYTGSQGDQGIQGIIGYTGSQGIQGNIGYTGSRGTTGYTGSQGTQGDIGYTGSQGIQGVGYTGSQGIIGYTGSLGSIGYTGSAGSLGYTPVNTVGDTMTGNLTMSNAYINLSDSDVAHGVTGLTSTDVYGYFMINSTTGGGLVVCGLTDADSNALKPVYLRGVHGHASPTLPAISLEACKANGTTIQALGDSETLFQLLNRTTAVMSVLGNGDVGLATSSPTGKLDISSGALSLVLGANPGSLTRTDGTMKYSRIATYHCTNAEEPMAMLMGEVALTTSALYVGGGSASMNATNVIALYTAANNTTLTGTQRMKIDGAGDVVFGSSNPYYGKVSVVKNSTYNAENAGGLVVHAGVTNKPAIHLGADASNMVSYIQSYLRDTSLYSLSLNPAGGNVGIGVEVPAFGVGGGLEIYRVGPATMRVNNTGTVVSEFRADADATRINMRTNHPFIVAYSATDLMRVDVNGNVGIHLGATAPSTTLHVKGPGTANGVTLTLDDSASGARSVHVDIKRNTSHVYMGVAGESASDPFFISRSAYSNNDFTISSTGKVGINMVNASEALEVAGNVKATRLNLTQTTGASPFIIVSTTKVTNLNSDMLDNTHLHEIGVLSMYKSSKDSNGIFTTITYKRSDATNYMTSVLSGGSSPQYTTRTETYYDTNGSTVLSTDVYSISYDGDGDVSSEVLT